MSIENNEYMYTIHYDNEPDDLYILDLLKDLKKKELKLLEVTPEFFIGKKISLHAILSDITQEKPNKCDVCVVKISSIR